MLPENPPKSFDSLLFDLYRVSKDRLKVAYAKRRVIPRRQQTLDGYMLAMIEAPVDHVIDGVLIKEELVMMLLQSAVYVQNNAGKKLEEDLEG